MNGIAALRAALFWAKTAEERRRERHPRDLGGNHRPLAELETIPNVMA